MRVIIIDAARFVTKAAAHEYIAKALDFPPYYGKNLDALADLLSELARDMAVVMPNADIAREYIGDYTDMIADTFEETLGGKGRFTVV